MASKRELFCRESIAVLNMVAVPQMLNPKNGLLYCNITSETVAQLTW